MSVHDSVCEFVSMGSGECVCQHECVCAREYMYTVGVDEYVGVSVCRGLCVCVCVCGCERKVAFTLSLFENCLCLPGYLCTLLVQPGHRVLLCSELWSSPGPFMCALGILGSDLD